MLVQWVMNSRLDVDTDEGIVLILSAHWRTFLMCSSYSKVG